MPDLTATTDLLKLFGDPTRARLLHLVGAEELTVAEITRVTGLAQSRVSTHLGKLHGAGLVRLRRAGSTTFASLDRSGMPAEARPLWELVSASADDALVAADRLAVQRVLAEAARVLRAGGTLVGVALRRHEHVDTADRYDHRQLGFEPAALAGLAKRAGLEVDACAVTSRERRAPHFEVITLHARRAEPGATPRTTPRKTRTRR